MLAEILSPLGTGRTPTGAGTTGPACLSALSCPSGVYTFCLSSALAAIKAVH
jgi:hypothetical protein